MGRKGDGEMGRKKVGEKGRRGVAMVRKGDGEEREMGRWKNVVLPVASHLSPIACCQPPIASR